MNIDMSCYAKHLATNIALFSENGKGFETRKQLIMDVLALALIELAKVKVVFRDTTAKMSQTQSSPKTSKLRIAFPSSPSHPQKLLAFFAFPNVSFSALSFSRFASFAFFSSALFSSFSFWAAVNSFLPLDFFDFLPFFFFFFLSLTWFEANSCICICGFWVCRTYACVVDVHEYYCVCCMLKFEYYICNRMHADLACSSEWKES